MGLRLPGLLAPPRAAGGGPQDGLAAPGPGPAHLAPTALGAARGWSVRRRSHRASCTSIPVHLCAAAGSSSREPRSRPNGRHSGAVPPGRGLVQRRAAPWPLAAVPRWRWAPAGLWPAGGSAPRWVATRRVTLRYVSSSPPFRTGLATFTASGSALSDQSLS